MLRAWMLRAGHPALVLSALWAMALWGAGCSTSYCSDSAHELEAMCTLSNGGTVAAFSVLPTRVTINKDSTTPLTITAYPKLVNQLATLTQPGGKTKPIPLGTVTSDGTLRPMVHASELLAQGFVPGPAFVEIANQKQPMRIYVAPKFDAATFSAAHSTVADHGAANMSAPVWVGVQATGNKKILTLDEYAIATIAKQAIGEYAYDAANKDLKKFSPLLFSAYNSTPYMEMSTRGMALSGVDLVVPEFGNASTSLITQCSLDGVCSGSTAAPYGSIASLTAAVRGPLYTGIFNGKVLGFSDGSLTTSIPITGTASSSATAAFVSVYDANADGHPDVSIWHRDGAVSVAVSDSTGKSLAYNVKESDSFKNLGNVGSAVPDAVVAGDIDQDGLDDFIVVKGGSLYILSNLGTGAFAPSEAIIIPTQGPTGAATLTPVSSIALGDVSADDGGFKDLVLVSKSSRFIAVMENLATVR